MQEQILIYFINFLFIYSIVRGIFKGGTSELISIVFFILGFMIAVHIFENTFYRTILSILAFWGTYSVGLFISYICKSHSTTEKITGGVMGLLKFFVFLTILTTQVLLMDSVPIMYKHNFFVSLIYPISTYLQTEIINKKRGRKKKESYRKSNKRKPKTRKNKKKKKKDIKKKTNEL